MSEPTSEPEKYSIDEMMDRLKNRDKSEDKGELVTRPDGSQAVKMKKRKRRSNQAVNKETKRNQRVQILQVAGFVIVIFLLFLAGGIGIFYANSTGFRESLIAKAESASGAKVTLNQFRMNPATANAAKVTMEWPKGNILGNLEARSPVAKIAPVSFLGKVFKGEEIVAVNGDLVLKTPVAGEPAGHTGGHDGKLPVNFSRYSVPILNIFFGGEKSREHVLEKTEASFFPSQTAGQGEIRLNQGLLKLKNWPPMALDRSYIRVRNSELDVQSMRFEIPAAPNQRTRSNNGFIDFSGLLKPLDPDATHTLSATLESFRLSYLLGADLGRFFLGNVTTKEIPDSNFLKFTPGSGEEALLEITITHSLDSRIDLSQFKFLGFLALALDERWYELPSFDSNASALLRRRGHDVELSMINFEQRGRMALKGSLSGGEAGQISGNLRVGIPETMIGATGNKRLDGMFGPVREGYRWVDLEIGGTSAAPVDDFKELYDAAQPQEKAASQPSPPDSFEDLIEGD